MNNLAELILSLLKEHNELKAPEIVRLIKEKYDLYCDKDIINKILYYQMKGQVFQDSSYRWSLEPKTIKQTQLKTNIDDTLLSNLASYYLECLSKDMEAGVSTYASSKYGSPDYGQLNFLPQLANSIDNIYDTQDVKHTINKVKQDRNRLVLQLGYPIFLKKAISKAGNPFYLVEPLFLIPFDTQSFINNNCPILLDDMPRINIEAIKSLTGLTNGILFDELLSLSEELGLNNTPDEQPNFEELSIRLQHIKPEWQWFDKILPDQLSSRVLKEETQVGIYNVAGVFYSERSRFTQGLEKELNDFKQYDKLKYQDTALGHWITQNFPKDTVKHTALIEPLPLNDEQRDAVNKALQLPLTVITGPPGTGKSQVVTSIIINAVFRGQTVLFASKNHKAIDVVFERVNGLSSRPIMLRLGDNTLQAALANYLSGLLSLTTSQEDHEQLRISKQRHEDYSNKIEKINSLQDVLIKIRNTTDDLEQKVEMHRDFFGDKIFGQVKNLDDNYINNLSLIIRNFASSLSEANKAEQSVFVKLFWFSLKKSRIDKVNKCLDKLKNHLLTLNMNCPNDFFEEASISAFYIFLEELYSNYERVKDIVNYFHSLGLLQKQKSLFQLALEGNRIERDIEENSFNLWDSWLKTLPDRLTKEDRHVLSDYATLLNLVVNANSKNIQPDKNIWRRYYSLQAKVTNILSCWAVASLSVRSKVPFEAGFFDLVIIDEASQCDIASALPLLYRAKRATIIGDSKQLTHITSINENQDIQLLNKYQLEQNYLSWSYVGKSLFGLAQSFCDSTNLVSLRDHHRSHSDIITFSNNEFYCETLRIATKYEKLKFIKNEPVLRWVDVKGTVVSPATGSSINQIEADSVIKELRRLVNIGYKGSIGVVTPFRPQANRIRDLINADLLLSQNLIARDILVDVVHSFQGDERDVIIFSPVIAQGIKSGSLLFLKRTGNLFNVAITRARAALIIIGDRNTCQTCGVDYMQRFVNYTSSLTANKAVDIGETYKNQSSEYPAVPANSMISVWEKILYEQLYKSGIRTLPQYKVEQYSLDLALILDDRRLDIEVDGEKYHRNWDGELCRRDQLRNKRLIELGWDVIRFWVYEIRDDIDGCVKRINAWMNQN